MKVYHTFIPLSSENKPRLRNFFHEFFRRLDIRARACYTIFMKYSYVSLYNRNAAFLEGRPTLKKALLFFNRYAVYFFAGAYALLLGYAAAKLSGKELARLLYLPAIALFSVSVFRAFFNRPRPYEKSGAGITPLEKKESVCNSFPSRHLTCAAVISTCFLAYFPLVGVLLLACTLALGYARFAIGWHYPSDLFVGFALGVLCGGVLFFL